MIVSDADIRYMVLHIDYTVINWFTCLSVVKQNNLKFNDQMENEG